MNLINLLKLLVKEGDIPPEFDAALYRLLHDDLAHMGDADLQAHYEAYGKTEGRLASLAGHRTGLLKAIPSTHAALEIGPFAKPALRGSHVAYFDVLDQAGLQQRALENGQDPSGCPKITYVSAVADLGIVDRKFKTVFSSHCIEHQPDLVRHLQQVEELLQTGGRYFLMIPDQRYCFDALLPPSTLVGVLEAYAERRQVHTYRSVYEHRVLTTHNDAPRHWAGDHADPRAHLRDEREAAARAEFEQSEGRYVDVHAWQFTPDSFRAIADGLHAARHTRLFPERVYQTLNGGVEFGAILRKA